MSWKTLIIDDEAPARRRLEELLGRDARYQLSGQAESGAEAILLIRSLQPDLILLDIQLKDITGFDVLQSVKGEFQGALIFITAYDDYAVRAFDVHAIDYLVKPYKGQRFQAALNRVDQVLSKQAQPDIERLLQQLREFQGQAASVLPIPEGRTTHYLDPVRLQYVQADGYYCKFHLHDGIKQIRIGLKQLIPLLPAHFVRINRSVIINRHKVVRTRALKHSVEIELENGIQFVAGKNYLREN